MDERRGTVGRRVGVRRRLVAVVSVVAAVAGLTVLLVAPASAQAPLAPGTPCTTAARACADLATNTAWLIENGAVVRGPVAFSPGGPGRETPRGDFVVEWKNRTHRSAEFDNAPMPYAVFFAPGGIAFHEGSLATTSAGCVRLGHDDAIAFFDFLAVGDVVQVR